QLWLDRIHEPDRRSGRCRLHGTCRRLRGRFGANVPLPRCPRQLASTVADENFESTSQGPEGNLSRRGGERAHRAQAANHYCLAVLDSVALLNCEVTVSSPIFFPMDLAASVEKR